MKKAKKMQKNTQKHSMKRAYLFMLAVCGLLGCATQTPAASNTMPQAHGAAAAVGADADVHSVTGAFESVMPMAVTSFGAVAVDDGIFVVGGYHGEPHNYSREGQSAALTRWRKSDGWSARAPMSVGLQGLAAVSHDGAIIVCGGNRIDNAQGAPTDMHSISDCARYTPSTNAWAALPAMPSARSSFQAAVVNNRLYAVGGWAVNGGPRQAAFASKVAVFDFATNTWSEIEQPFMRRALAVVSVNSHVVAIGGLGSDMTPSTQVDVFDPARNAWSQGPEFPSDAFGLAAVALGDHVYASGREGVVYRWAPGQTEWTRVASLAFPRFFHQLVPTPDGDLLALGGIGSMTTEGRNRVVERISIARRTERARVGVVEISYPGGARNRSGMFAFDDSLFIVGGNNSAEQHDFAPENFEARVDRLHVPALRWFPGGALPSGRQSMQTITHDGVALMLGGFGHGEQAPRTFATSFIYRSENETWQTIDNAIPVPRTQFGVVFYQDALWVFGGLDYDQARPREDQFRHLTTMVRCPVDHEALEHGGADARVIGACEELSVQMPGTRRALASALHDGRIYVVGGMREGFATVDDCYTFDLAGRTWAPFTCPSRPRVSADFISFHGKLYLVGGSSRQGEGLVADRSVEAFDPATGQWSRVIEQLPFDTHQARFVTYRNRLLAVSTQASEHHALLAWIDLDEN